MKAFAWCNAKEAARDLVWAMQRKRGWSRIKKLAWDSVGACAGAGNVAVTRRGCRARERWGLRSGSVLQECCWWQSPKLLIWRSCFLTSAAYSSRSLTFGLITSFYFCGGFLPCFYFVWLLAVRAGYTKGEKEAWISSHSFGGRSFKLTKKKKKKGNNSEQWAFPEETQTLFWGGLGVCVFHSLCTQVSRNLNISRLPFANSPMMELDASI